MGPGASWRARRAVFWAGLSGMVGGMKVWGVEASWELLEGSEAESVGFGAPGTADGLLATGRLLGSKLVNLEVLRAVRVARPAGSMSSAVVGSGER